MLLHLTHVKRELLFLGLGRSHHELRLHGGIVCCDEAVRRGRLLGRDVLAQALVLTQLFLARLVIIGTDPLGLGASLRVALQQTGQAVFQSLCPPRNLLVMQTDLVCVAEGIETGILVPLGQSDSGELVDVIGILVLGLYLVEVLFGDHGHAIDVPGHSKIPVI